MLRWALTMAVFALFLAGCSSSPSATPADGEQSSTFVVTAAPALDTTPRTDTLFLLDPPHLAGQLPGGDATIRTQVPSDLYPGNVPLPTWVLPRPAVPELVTSISIWVEVQGVVTNYANPTGGCFWFVALHFEDESGPLNNVASACAPEPGIVPEGIREVVIDVPETDIQNLAGVRLAATVVTYGTYTPGARADILSGTADHPSAITIAGLQLPIDTQTLLL